MRSACKIILVLAWYFVFMRDGAPVQVGPFDSKEECKQAEQKVLSRSTTLVPYRILLECWERKDRERRGRAAVSLPMYPFGGFDARDQ